MNRLPLRNTLSIVVLSAALSAAGSAVGQGCPATDQYAAMPGRSFLYTFFAHAPNSYNNLIVETGAVNNYGQLLAHYGQGNIPPGSRNFVLKGGLISPLDAGPLDPRLTGKTIYLTGLDDGGGYAGYASPVGNTPAFSFFWNDKTIVPIAVPGARETQVFGMNSNHAFVGSFSLPETGVRRGFVFDGPSGSLQQATAPGGAAIETMLTGVNQRGDAVGFFWNTGAPGDAFGFSTDAGGFILTKDKRLLYIDASRVFNPYGQLTECSARSVTPLGINDLGEVVGTAQLRYRGYIISSSFYYYRGVFQLLDPGYGGEGSITAIDNQGIIYGVAPNRGPDHDPKKPVINFEFFSGLPSRLSATTPWYDNVKAIVLPSGPQAQGDTMFPGQTLLSGQSITSRNGQFTLLYQGDGNLVLSQNAYGLALWTSKTDRTPVGVLIMQTDGNLVIYDRYHNVPYASGTWQYPGTRLIVQDDGNLVAYRPDGKVAFATGTNTRVLPMGADARGDRMMPGTVLKRGQSITSPNGRYKLAFNGTLSLTQSGKQIWSSVWNGQTSYPSEVCIMQTDGNLVIYDEADKATWATHSSKNPGAYLRVQDDGNVVLYLPNGTPIWRTNTVQ